jgi:type IV pilus assembly protein PilA
MRNDKGFSLIELLIVVAIILIIAAVAIPSLLRARIAANEASAVSSTRTINTAMVTYFSTYPTTGYAATLVALGPSAAIPCAPAIANACLIDGTLAQGGKHGYLLSATGAGVVGGVAMNYYAAANPLNLHASGDRSFCSNDDGVVRVDGTGTPIASRATCLALLPLQ